MAFIKPKVRTYERDLGFRQSMKEIKKMDKSFTKVGFPDGGQVISSGGETQYVDMSELASVAATHEYGAPKRNIPERSFIRSAVDENRSKIAELQKIEAGKVLDAKSDAKRALGRIGAFVKGKIQRKITTGPFEPLSEKTINARIRKSTKPLIDTGQMRASVQHVEEIHG